MIITPKETTIAYRCPSCGKGVKSIVGIFSLTGDRMRLKCQCGESHLDIEKNKSGKVKVTVPCMLCGTDHSFTIADDSFFKKELFKYPCTYTGIDCCFIGTEEKVDGALEKNEADIVELCKQVGLGDPSDMLRANSSDDSDDDDMENTGEDVLDTIVFVLRDLLDTGSIKCKCDAPDFDYVLCKGYVKVFCKNCGASADIPARGKSDAEHFLECYELDLK